jgi:integrase
MDYLLPAFKRELKYRKLTEHTIYNYERSFKLYREWCDSCGYKFELTPERYVAWSEWLKQVRAPRTVNLYLMLMRAFASWGHGEGDFDFVLPAISVDPGPSKPQVLEDDTLKRLLQIVKQDPRKLALRNELIIRLLLDTGVRRAELIGIRLQDINQDDMSIWVMGKGSKPRFVYYGNNTGRALDRYLRVRGQFPHADSPWLLLGQQGHLKASGIKKFISTLKTKAGLSHLRPHMFRHTFAHDWLDSGGSERDLMRVAGWASDEMLKVYGSERAEQRASGSHKRLSRGDRV